MYPSGKIEIKGAKELEKVLRELPRKISEDVLTRAVRTGANVIKKEAIARAPRGTQPAHPKYGHLYKNIKATKRRNKGGAATIVVHTGKAFWGTFLEFGTSHQSARPWFRPAFDTKYREALDKIGEQLGKNIETAATKLAGKYGSLNKAWRRRIARS